MKCLRFASSLVLELCRRLAIDKSKAVHLGSAIGDGRVRCRGVLRPIQIAGGGLAGLTLGILLRRKEIPVEIWEAGSYPRHRVCGEFVSGRGLALLAEWGLVEHLPGCWMNSVRLISENGATNQMALPDRAWSVSRYSLDHALATCFVEAGGQLFQNRRWTEEFREGVVRATGRRLKKASDGKTYNGFKVHARNLAPSTDLELHFSASGYVGVSRLPDGEANICGIFRAKGNFKDTRSAHRDFFERVLFGRTKTEFSKAALNEKSFCGVAGISLERASATEANECRIGDSICMIPPFTGNGMSLALESAQIAAPLLVGYARGDLEWRAVRRKISQTCHSAFRRRLWFSSILQKLAVSPHYRGLILSSFKTFPKLLELCFRVTR
ncbi:MAG TPA: hypothetical protein VGR78_18700 [Verrucomicrobiae bacterium]|nr:hypothetical protein [Verrucomicrobiae bacterium]